MKYLIRNYYYVEVKEKSARRFDKIIFHSEEVEECEKFIEETKEKGKVYRIVDSLSNLKSKVIC